MGQSHPFSHRPSLGIERHGETAVKRVLASDLLPAHLHQSYEAITRELLAAIAECFEQAGDYRPIRLHGDCHPGNMLWTEQGPLFVDLDDCLSGPSVQDLWMLLSGDRDHRSAQVAMVLDGYEQFREFDYRELHLVEALRGLRMMHHAGWILARWDDPAFPAAFPWVGEARWWEDHVAALRDQIDQCREPAITAW